MTKYLLSTLVVLLTTTQVFAQAGSGAGAGAGVGASSATGSGSTGTTSNTSTGTMSSPNSTGSSAGRLNSTSGQTGTPALPGNQTTQGSSLAEEIRGRNTNQRNNTDVRSGNSQNRAMNNSLYNDDGTLKSTTSGQNRGTIAPTTPGVPQPTTHDISNPNPPVRQ